MKVINIKINRYPEEIQGVEIYTNGNLITIIRNPVDYVLDGICYVNKRFIKKEIDEKEDALKLKILSYKAQSVIIDECYKNFTSLADVLKYFSNKKNKLVELGFESQEYSLIGNVLDVNEKSFLFNMLSVKGKPLRVERLNIDKIRIISVENDYLNSLEYYLSENL